MDERQDDESKVHAAGEVASAGVEDELEAEQESAEAMDAEVPQPPDASKTTEGQPS